MSIPELVEWHHGHRHEKKSAEDAEGPSQRSVCGPVLDMSAT